MSGKVKGDRNMYLMQGSFVTPIIERDVGMERKKVQKVFYLSKEDVDLLKLIKEKMGAKSQSQTITWLIRNAETSQEKIAKAVRKELEKHYMSPTRILCATKTAEQNSTVILDQLNTLLHMFNAKDCISVEENPHPAILQSQRKLKKKIVQLKQKKNRRMGI